MSSYAVMNENWMILSWVMLQSESEQSLESMYCGLASRYSAAGIPKAKYQWVDRDCCAAFRVMDPAPYEHLQWDAWRTTEAIVAEVTAGNLRNLLDQSDLEKLRNAYKFCGTEPANPTKQHIREHCRTKVPHPRELVQRVEEVLQHFHLAKDPNNILLFKPSMLKIWWIQRVHILRGCLSDPEVEEGILYRHGGTLQLNHVKGEGAAVPIWVPVRGTSQQEGFHFHQAQWVTGNRVSPELFQAQGMTGVARWNYQRLVDLKQPGVILPAVFDPVLLMELNRASVRVTGQPKYPALHISSRDTGEKFGLQLFPLVWEEETTSGQYYILSSRLCCKACKKYWFADKPQWLDMLPKQFCNILPAFLTHKKAICKTVMDELRCSGKSPNDMANQLSEVLHLKYERAHLAYLLSVQNIRDAERGLSLGH
ncbi:hypothetical protein PDJAM_G00196190 [Pangasius djambal]|uniref:Uncharacterized protein n=1 Tax=Pangasius djambal TaxID=1691987 RepID=A0ACC5Y6E6_9TELE|nr:hypothetical protein [Pangasius djambal]